MSGLHFFSNGDSASATTKLADHELSSIASLSADAALVSLDTSFNGLFSREVKERLARYGANTVAHEVRHSPVLRFLALFASPLSLLLLALSVVSYLSGEVKGAVVIAIMVVLSALLSSVQEFRSNKAAERLRAIVGTRVTVFRNTQRVRSRSAHTPTAQAEVNSVGPHEIEVPLANVVPGDIVHLSAGDIVPADVRIISAKDLFVNQAALTGESMPIEKYALPIEKTPGSAPRAIG